MKTYEQQTDEGLVSWDAEPGTTHSKLPWWCPPKLPNEADIYDGNGAAIGIMQYTGAEPPLPADMAHANALFVAKAVNNHERLLNALVALTCTARTFRNVPKDEQEWIDSDDAALEEAFAAIAEACKPEEME